MEYVGADPPRNRRLNQPSAQVTALKGGQGRTRAEWARCISSNRTSSHEIPNTERGNRSDSEVTRASESVHIPHDGSSEIVGIFLSIRQLLVARRAICVTVRAAQIAHRRPRAQDGAYAVRLNFERIGNDEVRHSALGTLASSLACLTFSLNLSAMDDPIDPPGPPNPPTKWNEESDNLPPILPPGVTPLPWTDCNHDGINDRAGVWPDCDHDGIVDWCEIEAGTGTDCNDNGVLDACELLLNPSLDCDSDGLFDACQPGFFAPDYPPGIAGPQDCNANGVSDLLEICRNPAVDCDNNGILDVCEIAGAASLDCDRNGVLDACDLFSHPTLDCNNNGVLDRCERECAAGNLGGPNYFGDGDWGIWYVTDVPPGCTPSVYALFGPIKVMSFDETSGMVEVAADPLEAGAVEPAMLRLVVTCANGCQCYKDVPLTVQAYAVLKIEARAFIPCGAAGFPDAAVYVDPLTGLFCQLCANAAIVGKGNCRDFDCTSQLPTNAEGVGGTPTSKVVVGTGGSMRVGATWRKWSSKGASTMAASQLIAPVTQWASCGGTVPVTGWGNRCSWLVNSWLPPCPVLPPGYAPPLPTVTDKSYGSPPTVPVTHVGSPRFKQLNLTIEEAQTCPIPFIGDPGVPTISLVAEVGLFQRCSPGSGMGPVLYDLLGAHDLFPAYEIVFDAIAAPPAESSHGCLYTCPPLGTLVDLMTNNASSIWPFFGGVHFDLRPNMINYAWPANQIQYTDGPPPPWRSLP